MLYDGRFLRRCAVSLLLLPMLLLDATLHAQVRSTRITTVANPQPAISGVDSVAVSPQTFVPFAATSPLVATVSFNGSLPTGAVAFQIDSAAAMNGTCNLTAAGLMQCVASYPTGSLSGAHTIRVTLLADRNYAAAQGSAPLTPGTYKPLIPLTIPTIQMTQGASTVPVSVNATFQAGLLPSTSPTVSIDGGAAANLACSLTGSNTATCGIPYPAGSLALGNHVVRVNVPGDDNYSPSSGFGLVTVLPAGGNVWVSAWGTSPTDAAVAGQEQSFRQVLKPTVGSRGTVRLHFSNHFGSSPVTLGAVTVAIQGAGATVSNPVPVTFNGLPHVTIPANGVLLSDPVALNFAYGSLLAVTEYVEGSWTALSRHAGIQLVTSYSTAAGAGDHTRDLTGASFTATTSDTYLLDRVDVLGNYKGTIAAFGSSTTEGANSGTDQHQTYPELLADALHAAGRDDLGIVNAGISGSTMTGSYPTAGLLRFSRDIPTIPGITAMIDYLGANDLRNFCIDSSTFLAAKTQLIQMAHAASIRVLEASTAPSTFCSVQSPGGYGTRFAQGSGEDGLRLQLVPWMLALQPTSVSGVVQMPPAVEGQIDFNGAITDPANLSYMLPAFDSGDDIHPNARGYAAMARSIPLGLF